MSHDNVRMRTCVYQLLWGSKFVLLFLYGSDTVLWMAFRSRNLFTKRVLVPLLSEFIRPRPICQTEKLIYIFLARKGFYQHLSFIDVSGK